ncbi:hypothetical protein HPB49_015596 [Dermacentor silvarum]|uniref:Uncharacterized protein n=1 Tax=Dermacentor silvarum TaxID=543639 RepID=A0ACB8D6F6_DERSI|nr:hypothetical protein HPB49_015596 [Dermacentor silvarum]
MDNFRCHGGLLFDEMKLSEHLSVEQSGKLRGFVDLGPFTPPQDANLPCDHGMVVMFVPFTGEFSQIIGAFATHGNVKGSLLCKILIEAIILVEKAGLFVDFLTCDGASWNRQMWTIMGIQGTANNVTCKVKHPADSKRSLHFLSHFPHLLKCLRNSLLKGGFNTPDERVKGEATPTLSETGYQGQIPTFPDPTQPLLVALPAAAGSDGSGRKTRRHRERSFRHAAAELSLNAARPALAPLGDPSAMATANQVTGYDPESLRVVSMDTAQTETPLPTEEEYLQDMIRVWRGRNNRGAASRDACAGAGQQQTAARSEHAQGGCAPCASSKRAKQLQWRRQNTPRIEKDGIIVVLKPRETIDLKATFGPGQAGAAIRSIIGDDASVGLVVWPVRDQKVLVCALKSVDAAERLLRDIMLPVGGCQLPFRGHLKLSGEYCRGVVTVCQDESLRKRETQTQYGTKCSVCAKAGGEPLLWCSLSWGPKVPRTMLYSYERFPVRLYKKTVPACPLCGTVGHRADACPRPQAGRCGSCGVQVPDATPDGPAEHQCVPSGLLCGGGHLTGAPGCAGRFRKPIKPGSPPGSKPKTGHKEVPTPKGGPKKAPTAQPEPKKASIPSVWRPLKFLGLHTSIPSPTETALQQQAKQAGPSERTQEAELDDADDGSSVKSFLSSVSRQTADTVVGSVSTAGHIGRLEALKRTTEQLAEQVAALPNQIMSAVSDSVLNAMQPWVSSQIKNATRCDTPLLKRKTASRQAAEESGSGPALGGPVQPLIGTAPAHGQSRSPNT